MKVSQSRRAGATETVGVSLDRETKRKLNALAEEAEPLTDKIARLAGEALAKVNARPRSMPS